LDDLQILCTSSRSDAQHELDSAKLMALVAQINELLEEEEREKTVLLSNPSPRKD